MMQQVWIAMNSNRLEQEQEVLLEALASTLLGSLSGAHSLESSQQINNPEITKTYLRSSSNSSQWAVKEKRKAAPQVVELRPEGRLKAKMLM